MSSAYQRHGIWVVRYVDHRGKVVERPSSAASQRHAEEAAARLEEMSRRIRAGEASAQEGK